MTTTVMRNDRDLLMKELKKSNNNNNNPHSNSHPRSDSHSSHPRSDSSSINKKDSMIWKIQAVTVHLEVKTDLHKVGRKIIS